MIACLLGFIGCIRYGISYDYFIYAEYIIFDYHHNEEPLSAALELIGHYTHPQVFFILSSIIITYCFFKVILRLSGNPTLSAFLYLGFPIYYFTNLSTVRQSLATAVVFLVLLINDREKFALLKKLAIIMVAYMFHNSAILCGILLLPIRKVKLKTMVGGIIACFFLGSVVSTILPLILPAGYIADKVNQYFFELNELSGHTLERLLCYGVTIAIIIKQKALIRLNRRNSYYIRLIYVGAMMLGLFSVSTHMAIRCFTFFASPLLLMIPDLVRVYHVKRIFLKSGCVLLLCASIYVGHVQSSSGLNRFYPFTAFWDVPILQIFTDVESAK